MLKIPVITSAFPPGNSWGITNKRGSTSLSLARLLHSAVSVGHDHGWAQIVGSQTGGQMEMLWKMAAFLTTVQEGAVRCGHTTVSRLLPTERFNNMGPSERRALTYHLGMTMSAAWASKVLNVPWMLHLDVYKAQLDPSLMLGDSRPDLVGQHPDGRWVVMECKGRASPPAQEAEAKAKLQAQRVTDIGGTPPSLRLAMFSYFGADNTASGRKKPRVVTMRAIDPPDRFDDPSPMSLPGLNPQTLFRLHYKPWRFLFEGDQPHASGIDGPLVWRDLKDVDLRVGILPSVASAMRTGDFGGMSDLIEREEARYALSTLYPDWVGDGIVLQLGDSWQQSLDMPDKEPTSNP